MDDVIVLIITLIIAVLGAIGQVKKKKNTSTVNASNNTVSNSTGNFWDFLEEQNNFSAKVTSENQFATIEEPPLPEEPVAETPKYSFIPSFEGISDITEEINMDLTKQPSAFKEDVKSSNTEKIPWRKAIIYSEIINRKYI